jgi:hypothetical protein
MAVSLVRDQKNSRTLVDDSRSWRIDVKVPLSFTVCLTEALADKVAIQMQRNGGNRNAAIRQLLYAGAALMDDASTPDTLSAAVSIVRAHIKLGPRAGGKL